MKTRNENSLLCGEVKCLIPGHVAERWGDSGCSQGTPHSQAWALVVAHGGGGGQVGEAIC